MKRNSSYLFQLFVGMVYAFLYVPLIILVIFSFNNNKFRFDWVGFTTKWYGMLWQSSEIWHAFYNSLTIAFFTVLLCLSMSALFIFFGSRSFVRSMLSLFYLNLAIPEIVMAVGLISFFAFFQIPLSLATLIAAHTVLGLGYVVPIIYDRYVELDKKYLEASRDLGATSWQTFTWVVLPLLSPALFASALLVFIISFDDFVLSFFCSGGSTQTLPMYIFAGIRAGTSPVISALSTVLLVLSSLMVLLFLSLGNRRMLR
jgi:spermidine/putrescine transport system permease protein